MIAIPQFGLGQVLVIGDVMLDRYVWGQVSRISPEAPVPVVRVMRRTMALGGAGNVAANLAGLGSRAACLGVCGTDEAGTTLGGLLATAGAEAVLTATASCPTTTKTRVMGQNQQLLRLDEEGGEPYPEQVYADLQKSLDDLLPGAGAVIVSDYGKGVFAQGRARAVIGRCRAMATPVFVDPKSEDWEAYRGADCITPNTAEFGLAARFAGLSGLSLDEAAAALLARYDLVSLLVTRGPQGMSLYRRDSEPLHIPTFAKEVFDVSGAGDTVIATLAAAVACGVPLAEAAGLANLAAGIVVGKLGTRPVFLAELEEAAARREGGPWRKVLGRDKAAQACAAWREQGKRVVFTNGCFDLLHVGHIKLLHEAAGLGDKLVVGLNSDASVGRLKGPTRPILPEDERAGLLSALECVAAVVIFPEDTPLELITALKPDVLVKGGDYTRETVVGHELVESWGGEVRLVALQAGKSTTGLIERLKSS